jgi:protein-arginine deiminase
MFDGKAWQSWQGGDKAASVTISALLADTEVMAASQQAQTAIDAAVAIVKKEAGLADDEIIEIPVLFEREQTGAGRYEVVAHMPGTVNMRVANGHVGIADPHGPIIDGKDYFQKDLNDRLGSSVNKLGVNGSGLEITFVEDWDDYHAMLGEVHCGSTSVAKAKNLTWWEAGR